MSTSFELVLVLCLRFRTPYENEEGVFVFVMGLRVCRGSSFSKGS